MKTLTESTVDISAVQNIFGNIVLSHSPHVNTLPLLWILAPSNTESILRKGLL